MASTATSRVLCWTRLTNTASTPRCFTTRGSAASATPRRSYSHFHLHGNNSTILRTPSSPFQSLPSTGNRIRWSTTMSTTPANNNSGVKMTRNSAANTTASNCTSQQQQQQRSFSVDSSNNTAPEPPYKSNEYPWATEPPSITRVTAADAALGKSATHIPVGSTNKKKSWLDIFSASEASESSSSSSSTTSAAAVDKAIDDTVSVDSQATTATASTSSTTTTMSSKQQPPLDPTQDPFDDFGTLTPVEHDLVRQAQSQHLRTTLSSNLEPVRSRPPLSVPPNVPSHQLATPETCCTTLDNGIRVVSQETYGQVSTIGVVTALGSRHENPAANGGVTNLLESVSFGATEEYTGGAHQIHALLQDWGGTRFCTTGREQSLHCVDLLRPGVSQAVHLLGQVVGRPQFVEEELAEARQALEFQALPAHMPPEVRLLEALQEGAYGKVADDAQPQQLGQPHFWLDATPLPTRDDAVEYWRTQVLENPHGMVVGGAGVQHDELVRLVDEEFGHLKAVRDGNGVSSVRVSVPSVYTGGECFVELPMTNEMMGSDDAAMAELATSDTEREANMTRVAVGLEVGGWHSKDLVATCVLQTLLGGGSSFSAGGPGKGMYSRLYRQVLNRYSWAESTEAFTVFHDESGLFGIQGRCDPEKARDLIQVFSRHLAILGTKPVTKEELDRAKNMLKCNVLTQLESRLILFEDMARQTLTYGRRENIAETCVKIDAVQASDLMDLAARALQKPPTVAAVGVDIRHVPRQEEVAQWFAAES